MAFKIRKSEHGDILGCEQCDSKVATEEFNSDRETKLLCDFCASMIGGRHDQVTKAMLNQGLNRLYSRLSQSTPKRGEGKERNETL